MSISKSTETMDYILDMLEQLGRLAQKDGLIGLAEGIHKVIAAERASHDPISAPDAQSRANPSRPAS